MYTIIRYGSITLPTYNTVYTGSPVAALPAILNTSNGAFDNYGSGRNLQALPFPLNYKCVVAEDLLASSLVALNALRGAVGTRNTLYRSADDDATEHSCIARLLSAPQVRPVGMRGYYEIELNFDQMTCWRGAAHDGWRLDTGVFFDGGVRHFDEGSTITLDTTPKLFNIINGGNYPIYDAAMILTAHGTNITAFQLSGGPTNFIWTGILTPGQSLIVDSGMFRVTASGVNTYSSLDLSFHESERLIEIPPGTTLFTATRTGGDASTLLSILYRDAWA